MFCIYCGSPNFHAGSYCTQCGKPLSKPRQTHATGSLRVPAVCLGGMILAGVLAYIFL